MKVSALPWDKIKIGLAVIPSFSLVLSCLYYFFLFAHFDGLNLNILSVKDYLDKSIEFIPVVGLLLVVVLLNLFLYPPRFKNETEQEHYKRIGGSAKIWKWHDIVFPIAATVGIIFSAATVLTPKHFLLTLCTLLVFVFFGKILLTIQKHTPVGFSERYMTKPNLYLFLGLLLVFIHVGRLAIDDAHMVKANPSHFEPRLIDVLEVGYLKQIGLNVVLEDKKGEVLVKVPISNYDSRSVFCRLGFKFACLTIDEN